MSTTVSNDTLLMEWRDAKKALDAAKNREATLREMIVKDSNLFDDQKEEGTQTIDLGNDFKLKCVKKINYRLANKDGETFAALEKLSAMGESSARVAKSLCRFTPELKISEYKKLEPEEKRIIDNVLTTSAGMPQLTLVEPKV